MAANLNYLFLLLLIIPVLLIIYAIYRGSQLLWIKSLGFNTNVKGDEQSIINTANRDSYRYSSSSFNPFGEEEEEVTGGKRRKRHIKKYKKYKK